MEGIIITRGSCPSEFTLCVATNLRSGPNPPAQKGRDLAVVGLRCNICNGKKQVDGDMVDKLVVGIELEVWMGRCGHD